MRLHALWILALAAAAACLLPLRSQNPAAAPYPTEEDAVRRGLEIGIGEATLDGPAEVAVDSLADLKLRYVAGAAGLATGGGIRIATGHGMGTDWGGNRLQSTDPGGENYLAIPGGFEWISHQGVAKNPLFAKYHPWQNINEFRRTGAAVRPGEAIEIALGRVRIQRWDETAFTLKFYVDARGDGRYLPLERNPRMRVVAGDADELNVVVPSQAETG
ncbi:MAG: hypothetical protein ACRD96_10825, partial [Bryobacteraceae bacterium]